MDNSEVLLEKLKKLLPQKESKTFYAKRLGITESEVLELLKLLHKKRIKSNNTIKNNNTISRKVNKEKGIIESTIVSDFEPLDDIELAKLHKIDLSRYVITNYWSKLLPNGKFTSSVFSRRKQPSDFTFEDFSKFLDSYTPKDIQIFKVDNPYNNKVIIDVEISIYDFHLAKKTIGPLETLEKRKEQYLDVLQDLVEKVRSCFIIRKIVFPISNDFFHTDNYQNQTTQLTPQDVLVSYDKEYEEGFDLLVTSINYLKAVSETVDVILVQGNHDRTKSFYLAHALEVVFKNNVDIVFHRKHSTTKFISLGTTFIGYHHGNCKIEELPLVFATSTDSCEAFGNAKYREVHTGDKHHYMAKEIKGVRMQQMPSLSGVDRWHEDNNFINNIRAGLALVYHPIVGKIAEFESRL